MLFAHWKWSLFALLFAAVAALAQDIPDPDSRLSFTVHPEAVTVVQKGQSATLSVAAKKGGETVSYQWFSTPDGTKKNAVKIDGATDRTYTTDVFTERGLRYYFCVAFVGEDSLRSQIVAVAHTGFPVLHVNTPNGVNITSKDVWTTGATMSLTDAEDPSWNFSNVKMSIRGRGNSTWFYERKKPYSIKLDKKKEIMGMPAHKRWVLLANYYDNTFMRNRLAFYLSETFKMDYTVRGRFVDLMFNGSYGGFYWLGESIKVDENRVNISDGYENMPDDVEKDYLIEMDSRFEDSVKFRSAHRDLPYVIVNDNYMVDNMGGITEEGTARLERFKAKIDNLEGLLYPSCPSGYNSNFCDPPDESYAEIIDVESWAKFWLINEIMDNEELQYPLSCFFTYENKKDLFKAGPVWDFDAGIVTTNYSVKLDKHLYYNALFKSRRFVAAVQKAWSDYAPGIDLDAEIARMRDSLRTAAKLDSVKWGIQHDIVQYGMAVFDESVDFLQNGLSKKMESVRKYVTETLPDVYIKPIISVFTFENRYTGKEVIPEVSVIDLDHDLKEGRDYDLTYLNNVNVGTAKVVFTAKGDYVGYQEFEFEILPAQVSLFVSNVSKMYGETDPELKYSIGGFSGDMEPLNKGIALSREPGEDVGSYRISVTADPALEPNYSVSVMNSGMFTITPYDKEITVTVTGHTDTVEYDGKSHSVNGFDMSSGYEAYSLEFVYYSGDSSVSGKDAKNYPMELSGMDFQNTSKNYTNVKFDITDGGLTILKKEEVTKPSPTEKTEEETEEKVEEKTEEKVEEKTEENTEGKTVEKAEEKTEEKTKESPTEKSEEKVVEKSAEETKESGEKAEKKDDKKKSASLVSRDDPAFLKIAVSGRQVQVNGALPGTRYAVFDMQGVVVRAGSAESASFGIPVTKSGVYVVRVGARTQRIQVR